jgi:predicted nucleic acid-binding protein
VTPLPADDDPLALDACGLLNLAAAMPLTNAATGLGVRLVCVSQVADESLYLEQEVDGAIERRPVDLSGLEIVTLDAMEIGTYVVLAATLDDGEAATLAAAQKRHWPVMTDDRKAARIAGTLDPPVEIRSTPAILKHIAELTGMTDVNIGRMLQRVETGASFRPPSQDPDHEWWRAHTTAAQQ